MNIRELILDSETIVKNIDAGEEKMRLGFICKSIDIRMHDLMEFLESENIVLENNPNATISIDLLKQILLKEPEISSPPSNLRSLILNSNSLLTKLNQESTSIRLSYLCRTLNIGIRKLKDLLESEGIVVDNNPNAKIQSDLLKQIIALKPKTISETDESILAELEEKIKQTDAKEYVKSVVLRQFLRSEQIREYAKIRAKGLCELCDKPAPFNDKYGNPFLETHHITYLSKGGQDTIDNVAAICPNCHRKMHNLNLKTDIDKLLNKRKINCA